MRETAVITRPSAPSATVPLAPVPLAPVADPAYSALASGSDPFALLLAGTSSTAAVSAWELVPIR